MRRYAILVAGGKGLRMGHELPKQLIPISGRPILMHTMQRFYDWDGTCEQIVVLPESQHAYWQMLCKEIPCTIPHVLVSGGSTRFESVKNGLNEVKEDSLVAVHDGVRPFITSQLLETCFEQAKLHTAVVPVAPLVESLREVIGQKSHSVDRNRFVSVQTPQVFISTVLKEAYSQPYSPLFTDDASVVEAMGREIVLVNGERENIKITEPIDLKIAEAIFSEHK